MCIHCSVQFQCMLYTHLLFFWFVSYKTEHQCSCENIETHRKSHRRYHFICGFCFYRNFILSLCVTSHTVNVSEYFTTISIKYSILLYSIIYTVLLAMQFIIIFTLSISMRTNKIIFRFLEHLMNSKIICR